VLRDRKRRMAIVTYDDLVLRLGEALDAGPDAVAKLRERYEVVLVDEFQDTDPDQWDILRTAFGDRALVLIGDPKQAIYAFRGGDVYAYLDAAGTVERQVLDRNHRSDGPLVKALDAVFAGAELGHPDIAYLPVQAVHAEPRISGARRGALRIRFALCDDVPERTGKGWAAAQPTRDYIARDVAEDIAELLGSDAQIEGRPVRPSDVAVLVRNRWQARDVCEALGRLEVPAVIAGAGSVFDTDAAREWLRLLEALERPGSGPRAHAAALTCFWGWSAADCAGAGDEQWEGVHDTLHRWAQVLRARGVASLVETVTREQDLAARMLGELGGERALTDVRHIGQLLHAAALSDGLGATALTQWLRRRIAEAERDTADEDRSRRLESDARAVQVLTVHRAKGLEFGIVYLPYQWDQGQGDRRPQPVVFHDGTKRLLDVSLTGEDYQAHKQRQLAEQRGEDLRLLYVALTRARHQVVLWWAATWASRDSALGRLLFARDGVTVPDSAAEPPRDERATEVFRELVRASDGTIALERAHRADPVGSWPGEPREETTLAVARFDRELDTTWRRTSYSALTTDVHEAPQVTSEPEQPGVQDEPESGAPAAGPWADVPVGMRVGTVVHRALEAIDFTAPAFGAEIAELGAEAGLRAALETPLGAPFGVRLADIAAADRLDELEFELPLTGGTLDRLAAVLRAHGDPYGERLSEVEAARLQGFLTGSLDLVARLPDGRFAIFDYKTNGLAAFDPAALREEMYRRHYGLQALLYAIALRRYLRWRAPEAEVAGVGYLFLRGMDGTEGAGVFAWVPSPELLGELDAAI
jgi:exodeoxyribonuclease V beta subunit